MKSIAIFFIIFGSFTWISFASELGKRFFEISFATADNGKIFANLYGTGEHAIVLAHGAIFNKESWGPLAVKLSEKGLQVLALDFRGYGKSKPGKKDRAFYEDILAAVRYLRVKGAKKVSVIGGSMGGEASAQAAVMAKESEIDKLILLSPVPIKTPELIKADKLFVASKNEGFVSKIKAQYEKAPGPKKIEFLEGNAHAQHIFKTDQSEELTNIIVKFLLDH